MIIHSEVKFDCDICGKQFLTKERTESHMKRWATKFCFEALLQNFIYVEIFYSFHLKVRDLKCSECGKKFFSPDQLRTHAYKHRGIRFNCFVPGCTASLSRRDALMTHVKGQHRLTAGERKDFTDKLNKFVESIKI